MAEQIRDEKPNETQISRELLAKSAALKKRQLY